MENVCLVYNFFLGTSTDILTEHIIYKIRSNGQIGNKTDIGEYAKILNFLIMTAIQN